MKAGRLLSVVVACVLLATVSVAAGATPLAGPCAPGTAYDPACDANHDGQITVTDIQLTAGHWNQTGTWVSDNQPQPPGADVDGQQQPTHDQRLVCYGRPGCVCVEQQQCHRQRPAGKLGSHRAVRGFGWR